MDYIIVSGNTPAALTTAAMYELATRGLQPHGSPFTGFNGMFYQAMESGPGPVLKYIAVGGPTPQTMADSVVNTLNTVPGATLYGDPIYSGQLFLQAITSAVDDVIIVEPPPSDPPVVDA
jgi:hypothetical protein